MKRFSIALAALALIVGTAAGPAQAQQQRRGRGGFGGGLSVLRLPAGLQDKLALSADQKDKIKAIEATAMQERQAAMQEAQNGGDRQAVFQKLRESGMKHEADAEALLSSTQKTTFDGWKTELMDFQGLGRAGIGLLGVSGLTNDQKTILKSLSTEAAQKQQELRQSAQGGDRQAARQKQQELQAQNLDAVKKILVGDQVKQFESSLPAPRMPRAGAAAAA